MLFEPNDGQRSQRRQNMIGLSLKAALGAAAVAVGLGFTAPAHATADGPDYYRVHGVKSWDVLNIRAWPSHRSRIVGAIPHNGRHVSNLVRRVRGWCLIRHRSVKGWSKCRYLQEQSIVDARFFRVRGVAYDDVLFVRRWPASYSLALGALPRHARNVVLIRRKGNWGKVRHRDLVGWVRMNYLRPDRS